MTLSLDQARQKLKASLLIQVYILIGIAGFAIYFYRIFSQNASLSLHFAALLSLLFLFLSRFTKSKGSIVFGSYFLLVCFSLLIPLRAFSTGGENSAVLVWCLSTVVLIGFLHSRLVFRVYTGYLLLLLIILGNMNLPEAIGSVHALSFSVALSLIVILMVTEKWKLLHQFELVVERRSEELETIKTLMSTLDHEINNPLEIVYGYLRILKKVYSDERLEKINYAVKRIESTIKAIKESALENSIYKTRYRDTGEIHIYHKNSDLKSKDNLIMKLSESIESQQAYNLVLVLQSRFSNALSKVFLEGGLSVKSVSWLRDEGKHGGGSRMVLESSSHINRGSINVSQVHYDDEDEKKLSSATALSTIIHPANPRLPSVHMHISWTEMKSGKGYWRIMADLNPSNPNGDDREYFIEALKEVSGDLYSHGQKQGDQYFYIPALQRHRGVAHFYLEGHNSGSFTNDLGLAKNFGETMIDRYCTILARASRRSEEATQTQAEYQLEYHTIYFFQVLTLDRGTTSGLLIHDQNDVGILGSLPSHVSRNLLLSWQEKLHGNQKELLHRLIEALPKQAVVEVSEDIKSNLCQVIRQFYHEFPEAIHDQAKGFTVPETVGNHK